MNFEQTVAFVSMIAGLGSLIVAIGGLIFIIMIYKNGRKMEEEIWSFITDISLVQKRGVPNPDFRLQKTHP